jgi:hypothetical protein
MRNAIIVAFLLFVSAEFSFAITKRAIKPSELPAAITADISVRYVSYSITEAYKVNDKNNITFEVIIINKNDRLILRYSSNGKFIRKEKVPSAPSK